MTKNPNMTDVPRRKSWLSAINEVAERQGIRLPPVSNQGMGSLVWQAQVGGRIASLRRPLVSIGEAEQHGIEWALWQEANDQPSRVVTFREALYPTEDRIPVLVMGLKGWLVDEWTIDQAKQFASEDPNSNLETAPYARNDSTIEYWLSDERTIGVVVKRDSWRILSSWESLATWRSRTGLEVGDSLSLASLDCFCKWLAGNWSEIAYGTDSRPAELRGSEAAASVAYDASQLIHASTTHAIHEWWTKHAIRAADSELPNVFIERQGDALIVSWDATPTPNRFYRIYSREETVPASFAVPVLRQLVADRLKIMNLPLTERDRLLNAISHSANNGYAAMALFSPTITRTWLNDHNFTDKDAQDISLAGTSRHPLVGLMRSSHGTGLTSEDYEGVLKVLRPSDSSSFHLIRTISTGMSSHVNIRKPWESGYRLAKLIRDALNVLPPENLDVEKLIQGLGIEIHDADFSDVEIRGVCVGTPSFRPLVVINRLCADANGPSGRRITLAHELCHLLFDRSRLRNLARFEWDSAENDRLLEMRANAFAVELLVPMATLVDEDGTVVDDDRLAEIAEERKVSLHALQPHAKNLRNRLADNTRS